MATQHRVIRLEITIDPEKYAAEHGVAVWEAIDDAAKRVTHAAQVVGERAGVNVARAQLSGVMQ